MPPVETADRKLWESSRHRSLGARFRPSAAHVSPGFVSCCPGHWPRETPVGLRANHQQEGLPHPGPTHPAHSLRTQNSPSGTAAPHHRARPQVLALPPGRCARWALGSLCGSALPPPHPSQASSAPLESRGPGALFLPLCSSGITVSTALGWRSCSKPPSAPSSESRVKTHPTSLHQTCAAASYSAPPQGCPGLPPPHLPPCPSLTPSPTPHRFFTAPLRLRLFPGSDLPQPSSATLHTPGSFPSISPPHP